MFLLNGESKHCVDISDRGLQYGDGLFETVEVLAGQPIFLHYHLERLALGCRKLLIPEVDWELLLSEINTLLADHDRAVLKLIVTRGAGGRGYRQPAEIHPTRLLAVYPYPEYCPEWRVNGVNVRFCDYKLAINPALAGIKHLNRLEQILARAEWDAETIQEGIMLDGHDHIVEGTMSNLFMVKNQQVITPLLTDAGIAGVMRRIVMALAGDMNIAVQQKNFFKDELLQADELFLTNSLIGIWPIARLDGLTFTVGPITRRLQLALQQRKTEELSRSSR